MTALYLSTIKARRRAKRSFSFRRKAESSLASYRDRLTFAADDAVYQSVLAKLREYIKASASPRGSVIILNHVIDLMVVDGDLKDRPRPSRQIIARRPKSIIRCGHLQRIHEVRPLLVALGRILNADELPKEALHLAAIATSLMYHSGLLEPALIRETLFLCCTRELIIYEMTGHCWIRLGEHPAASESGQALAWLVDPISLSLINRYLQEPSFACSGLIRPDFMGLAKFGLKDLWSKQPSLAHLCNSFAAFKGIQVNPLRSLDVSICRGWVESSHADHLLMQRMLGVDTTPPSTGPFAIKQFTPAKGHRNRLTQLSDCDAVLNGIEDALKRKEGRYQGRTAVAGSLKALVDCHEEESLVRICLLYMIQRLTPGGKKKVISVSSLATYYWNCLKYFLIVASELDTDQPYCALCESVIAAVLERAASDNHRERCAFLMREVFAHAAGQYGVPSMKYAFGDKKSSADWVRVDLITAPEMDKVYFAIDRAEFSGRDTRHQIKLMALLAYRLGLRIAELAYLRTNTLELDFGIVIRVKTPSRANNKTHSGDRRILCNAFLTPPELTAFRQYLDYFRRVSRGKRGRYLFSPDPEHRSHFTPNYLSNLFSNLMRHSLGRPVSVHLLRHTALSRLAVVLLGSEALARQHYGISTDEYLRIRSYFNHGDPFENVNIAHELAAFAGHISPAMTFKHYVHTLGFCVNERLLDCEAELSERQIARVANVSERTVQRLLSRHELSAEKVPLSLLLPEVQRISRRAGFPWYQCLPKGKPGKTYDWSQSFTRQALGEVFDISCHRILYAAFLDMWQQTPAEVPFPAALVPPRLLAAWNEHAGALLEQRSRKGGCFFGTRESSHWPQAPRNPKSIAFADKLIGTALTLHWQQQAHVVTQAAAGLKGLDLSDGGIRFDSPEPLNLFVIRLQPLLPRMAWQVSLYSNAGEIADWKTTQWRQALDGLRCVSKDGPKSGQSSQVIYARLSLYPAFVGEGQSLRSLRPHALLTYCLLQLAVIQPALGFGKRPASCPGRKTQMGLGTEGSDKRSEDEDLIHI